MLQNGSRGAEVTTLQEMLAAAGFDPGVVDGVFGPNTEAALRLWQEDQGLEVTGAYDPATAETAGTNTTEPP